MTQNTQRADQMAIWHSEELCKATLGRAYGGSFVCRGVSIDTRTLQPGDVFVALKGQNNDGHAFIPQALAKGAAGVICEDVKVIDLPQIEVSDSYLALWHLARAARARFKGRVVAVTGSVGKTSLKDMLFNSFKDLISVHASPGNYNNQIGVPLTWCNCPQDAKLAIIEMGMNHKGELSNLSQLSRPHIGILTAIGQAHRGHFRDLAALLAAKLELLIGLKVRSHLIVLRHDLDQFSQIRQKALERSLKLLSVRACSLNDQEHQDAITFEKPEIRSAMTVATAFVQDQPVEIKIQALGSQWIELAGMVLMLGKILNLDEQRVLASLQTYQPLPGRGHYLRVTHRNARIDVLDESYSASPESVIRMIETVQNIPAKRKLLVLGDLLELGNLTQDIHQNIGKHCIDAKIDAVFCLGEAMRDLVNTITSHPRGIKADIKASHFSDKETCWHALEAFLQDQDLVAIKGSNAMNMEFFIKQFSQKPQSL